MTPVIALASRRLSPIDQLGEDIAELAARIHAATYELLVMLRQFDAEAGWNNGFLSCAHWLNGGRASTSVRRARRFARRGRWGGLPLISAAMHRALEAAADQLYREAKAAPNAGGLSDDVGWGQRRADALGRLAEVALAADLDAGTAGDRYQVVLHVDANADQTADGDQFDGALEVTDGALRVSAETSRRLACDSAVVQMQHDHDGNVLDVGRKTRTIPPEIRRALHARNNRCQFPGCTARRCDAHHIEHWVDGGATNLDNLLLLCRRHHRTVHEGTIRLARHEDGTMAFFHQNGLPVPQAPPLPRWAHRNPLTPTTDRLSAAGIAINARTLPTWDGTPFNVVHAIDVLYVPPA